jgi:hypothetical protein
MEIRITTTTIQIFLNSYNMMSNTLPDKFVRTLDELLIYLADVMLESHDPSVDAFWNRVNE